VRAEMVTDAEVNVCPHITFLINVSCREYLWEKINGEINEAKDSQDDHSNNFRAGNHP